MGPASHGFAAAGPFRRPGQGSSRAEVAAADWRRGRAGGQADPMSIAFLFPGRGSQRPGMLHRLPDTAASATVLAEADWALRSLAPSPAGGQGGEGPGREYADGI